MVNVFGHAVEITTARQCTRSATDHITLRNDARVDRQDRGFDTEQSFVLCGFCGKLIALKV